MPNHFVYPPRCCVCLASSYGECAVEGSYSFTQMNQTTTWRVTEMVPLCEQCLRQRRGAAVGVTLRVALLTAAGLGVGLALGSGHPVLGGLIGLAVGSVWGMFVWAKSVPDTARLNVEPVAPEALTGFGMRSRSVEPEFRLIMRFANAEYQRLFDDANTGRSAPYRQFQLPKL